MDEKEKTCAFCSNPVGDEPILLKLESMYPNGPSEAHIICPSCYKKIKLLEQDGTTNPNNNKPAEDEHPWKAFAGMLLKDFVISNAYLSMEQPIVFCTANDVPITNIFPWMDASIVFMSENPDGMVHVLLKQYEHAVE